MTDDEIINRIREEDADGELPPPAPPEAVAELEEAVGHPMPPLLKRISLEVADGGFGRWGEALSLTDTVYSFSDSRRLLEEYPEDLTLAQRLCGWLDGRNDFPEAPAGPYCPECRN
ncbi:hypothetical protein [Streptomyces sp. NPDC005209]|uniref:hypothetical protein n=1 Tax=Streptomyces sp. NPDC005209 TaxID=3156715 RepID=UPI0033AC9CCF